jgi:hypothetical protein
MSTLLKRQNLGCLIALLGALFLSGCVQVSSTSDDVAQQGSLTFVQAPRVLPNPNPRVPLAALIEFETSQPVKAWVDVDDGQRRWTLDFDSAYEAKKSLAIVGMRADRQHRFTLRLENTSGARLAANHQLGFTTPPLPVSPLEFPQVKVNVANSDKMEPGFTLLSVRRRPVGRGAMFTDKQFKFAREWGLLLGLDNQGEVIWYYKNDTRNAGIEQLSNGNLVLHRADFSSIEIDMLGNKVSEWYAGLRPQGPKANAVAIAGAQTLHHQPHEMPNGHFLGFTANEKTFDNYYTSEIDPDAPRKTQTIMGDKIIEFNREGEVLWSWDTFDHLDPFRIGYNTFMAYWHTRGFKGTLDWTHGNGLDYVADEDAVIISLRLQDAIIKIDRNSGDIVWILGEHSDWPEHLQSKLLQPQGDLIWPYHAHNPRVSEAGTLVVFDNGMMRARPFGEGLPPEEAYSRAVEYKIDEQNMTVTQVWSSEDTPGETPCNAWAMGDAHRLPSTDNILAVYAFCVPRVAGMTWNDWEPTLHVDDFPMGGRVREYARNSPTEVVFSVDIEDKNDLLQWEVYGGFRTPSLYRSNKGTH